VGVLRPAMIDPYQVTVLDVSHMKYEDQVTAASLQGLVNRDQPSLFLDYGVYDDPESRKTNEAFISEDLWQEKFRDFLGRQDRLNLTAYEKMYPIEEQNENDLEEVVKQFIPILKGFVIWDPEQEDSINIAIMLSSLENLLPISPDHIDWAKQFDLPILHDLRGRWKNRIVMYSWALENLFSRCTPGKVACIEPGWHRPEFIDYVVKEKIFTYSLSSKGNGKTYKNGWNLLLFCLGGPGWLRNFIYNIGLFHWLKKIAIQKMAADPEVNLAITIQKKVSLQPGAIIFGWHTVRDGELAFMVLLSANGLRLVPSHLAANFSFHSALPAQEPLKQFHVHESDVNLEPEKTYLTFTYSDGDQLMLMNTAQIGGWRRPERGMVPFNWEMQPLLVELAPALLGLFYSTLTTNDCLVAGPSGAGYIIPPLHDDLPNYLLQTAQICEKADINVITSYYPDPPERIIRQHLHAPNNILGFLSGYFFLKSKPVRWGSGKIFLCNAWPHTSHIPDSSEEVLSGVRTLINTATQTPRFIGIHLFAYKTTITDVYNFVQTLDPAKVKVVRADEFLILAKKYYENKR
jgi:hypothetical protein